MVARYLNQQPPSQSYSDHNGKKTNVDTKNDIELHRVLVWLKGFAYDPKLTYSINFWTVNSSKNINTIGYFNYDFTKWFALGAGIEGLPGVRSLNGQHPHHRCRGNRSRIHERIHLVTFRFFNRRNSSYVIRKPRWCGRIWGLDASLIL